MKDSDFRCRICGGSDLRPVKQGIPQSELLPDNFAITDPRYGQTLSIYSCNACGFMQCQNIENLLGYYQDLVDPAYEHGRPQRKLQAIGILNHIKSSLPAHKSLTLVDVGAGSGILVEAALEMGFNAVGVEPSRWLQETAARAGIPIILGTVDELPPDARYDVVVLADVIEHVSNPVDLLNECASRLATDGTLAVLTPDRQSVAARVFGWRWWHYRVAHINYFDKKSIFAALSQAGLTPQCTTRPGWRFSLKYLCERLELYIPKQFIPRILYTDKISISLNLLDSLMILANKHEQHDI